MRARTALPFLCVLALFAPSAAGAHTLDRPAKLNLEARSELQHDALHHSTSVLRFFRRHPKIMRKPYHARIARREIRFHRKQRVWTKRELRETMKAMAALRAQTPTSVEEIICTVFGGYCSQALSVARCESGLNVNASNRGIYLGIFQMGSSERAIYGHGPDALSQAQAAYRYFVATKRTWGPWSCKP